MDTDANYEKGDLLRWYWEDEELIGLFLGVKRDKYLIYVFDTYFRKTNIKRYKSMTSLKLEWKRVIDN